MPTSCQLDPSKINATIVPDPRIIPSSKAQDDSDFLSIKEHGVLQSILVAKWPEGYASAGEEYVLIAGRRRLRLALKAGCHSVPCIVRDEPATPENIEGLFRDLAAAENMHREEMHAVEVAAEIARRLAAKASPKQIADDLSLSPPNVRNYARLAEAPFFGLMVERVKSAAPVPSFRKCLAILGMHKEGKNQSKEQANVRTANLIQTFSAECSAEEKAIDMAKLPDGSNGPAPRGKGKKGGGAAKGLPKKVQEWWKAAEAVLKSGKHIQGCYRNDVGNLVLEQSPDAPAITEEERAQLVAATNMLAFVYQDKPSPVFTLNPAKKDKPKKEGKKGKKAS